MNVGTCMGQQIHIETLTMQSEELMPAIHYTNHYAVNKPWICLSMPIDSQSLKVN